MSVQNSSAVSITGGSIIGTPVSGSSVASSNVNISGGKLNGTPIGATSPSSATFTAVVATSGISAAQYPTTDAPAYAKGLIYFDTTLNKLRVGGGTTWETITST